MAKTGYQRRHSPAAGLALCLILMVCGAGADDAARFARAAENALIVQRAMKLVGVQVQGWGSTVDPATGLWFDGPHRESESLLSLYGHVLADEYPFFASGAVLLNDSAALYGPALGILEAEKKFHPDIGESGRVPSEVSEYLRDGLLPIIELLGESPWSERAIDLMDQVWSVASKETASGPIPDNFWELPGNLIQTLNRLYWITGEERFLDYALRYGDYFIGTEPASYPERISSPPPVHDHGGEHIPGLLELYANCAFARPQKREVYRQAVHGLVDDIITNVTDEYGMFGPMSDNWGYVMGGVYTVYMVDSTEAYYNAVERALTALTRPPYDTLFFTLNDAMWDAVEGAIHQYNRIRVEGVEAWIDERMPAEIQIRENNAAAGRYEFHGAVLPFGKGKFAGNSVRTVLLYTHMKAMGTSVDPWDSPVAYGASGNDDSLFFHIESDDTWEGVVRIDAPRHSTLLSMPMDFDRYNAWNEWFVAEPDHMYAVYETTTGAQQTFSGAELIKGIPLSLQPGEPRQYRIIDLNTPVPTLETSTCAARTLRPLTQRLVIPDSWGNFNRGATGRWNSGPPRIVGPSGRVVGLGRPGSLLGRPGRKNRMSSGFYLIVPQR